MKFLSGFLPFVLIATASVVRGTAVDMEAYYNEALNDAKSLVDFIDETATYKLFSSDESFNEVMASVSGLDSAIGGDENEYNYWSLVMTRASEFETLLQRSEFAAATIEKIDSVLNGIHNEIIRLFTGPDHKTPENDRDAGSEATTNETISSGPDSIRDKDNANEAEMQKLYRLLYHIKAAKHNIVEKLNARFQTKNTNAGEWKRLAQQELIKIAKGGSKAAYADRIEQVYSDEADYDSDIENFDQNRAAHGNEMKGFYQAEAVYADEIECFNQVVTLVEWFKLYYSAYSINAYVDAELGLEKKTLEAFESRSAAIDNESIKRANEMLRFDLKDYAPLKKEVMEFYHNFSHREKDTIPIRFIYDLYNMWERIQRGNSAQADNISGQADPIIVQAIKSETINLIEDVEAYFVPRIVAVAEGSHGALAFKALSYAASPSHRVLAKLVKDVNSGWETLLWNSDKLVQNPGDPWLRNLIEAELEDFNSLLEIYDTLVAELESEEEPQNAHTQKLLEEARRTLTTADEAYSRTKLSIENSKNRNCKRGLARFTSCFPQSRQPSRPMADTREYYFE